MLEHIRQLLLTEADPKMRALDEARAIADGAETIRRDGRAACFDPPSDAAARPGGG